jgi:transcriptional regulator with XRE-family HTH domain
LPIHPAGYTIFVKGGGYMDDIQSKTGKRIREFRNAKGYSIEELAHLAGLNAVHLASLERGEKNATLATLEKVLNALDISFNALFDPSDKAVAQTDPINDKIAAVLNTFSSEEKQFIYDTALFVSRNKKESKR